MLIGQLCSCFGDVSVQVFHPFLFGLLVFLLLSLKSSLYILGTSALTDVSFADTFSLPMACLLLLLTLSFAEQEFSPC